MEDMQVCARHKMKSMEVRFVGVELYFENVDEAKRCHAETLGLKVSDEKPGHPARFNGSSGFNCPEKQGFENHPSKDEAVLFFEVPDLAAAIRQIGEEKIVHAEKSWAVLHDPEGHNVLLLEKSR